MANTYTQIYVHVVFAVKRRACLISNAWKDEMFKYITGIISNKNQKLMVMNSMPDHMHLLIGLKPDCNLSDLVRDIKSCSSKWIKEKQFVKGRFEWQTGFGAFSIGQSQVPRVVRYIVNQEAHHRKKAFLKEYIQLLEAYNVNFNNDYLFEEIDIAPPEL